jgi:membrane-associated phospholipid phosphatase
MKSALLLLLIFFCAVIGRAQQKPEAGYFKSYVTDTRDLLVQPTQWQGKDWLVFSGSIAAFTVLFTFDGEIQNWFQNNRTDQTEWVSTYIAEPIGSGVYTLPALGILYGTGWLSDNKKARYVALKGAEAWLLTGGATLVLKQLFHRQRPDEGAFADPYYWLGPYALTRDNTSFPSGHTSTAWAVAAVVATSYKAWWIKGLSYGLASLAGLSRIHDNKHWASDVFVGALLGWWVGHSLVKNQSDLQWGATAGMNHLSGSLIWRF